METVYRFKGQSAPAIILSEVDFDELNDNERRKVFVGMTRACIAVDLVMSRRAEKCFAALVG